MVKDLHVGETERVVSPIKDKWRSDTIYMNNTYHNLEEGEIISYDFDRREWNRYRFHDRGPIDYLK